MPLHVSCGSQGPWLARQTVEAEANWQSLQQSSLESSHTALFLNLHVDASQHALLPHWELPPQSQSSPASTMPLPHTGSPMVVIVNRELARRTWPGESPIGKRITLSEPPDVEHTVVGVVGNVKQLTLSHPDEPQLYVAKAQHGGIFHSVAARTAGDPDAMAEQVRGAIWAVDRDQPVWKIRSMASLIDRDLAPRRFTARLAGGFAVLVDISFLGLRGSRVGRPARRRCARHEPSA